MREPLVQFLLLGAALFALSGLIAGRRLGKERIVVSRGQIESLAAMFERTWMRPPTVDELDGLVRDHLREEVAYREARAMGLERDDTVIRRRLRQKLEFLSEQVMEVEPTDAELAAYLAAHPEAFRQEGSVSFVQVFLDPERRGERPRGRRRRGSWATCGEPVRPPTRAPLGDPTLLEPEMTTATPSEIAAPSVPTSRRRSSPFPRESGGDRFPRPTACTWSWCGNGPTGGCRRSTNSAPRCAASGSTRAARRRWTASTKD